MRHNRRHMTTSKPNAKNGHYFLSLVFIATLATSFPLLDLPAAQAAASDSVAIKDGALLYNQIKEGYTKGQRDFVVPPGRYTFPADFTIFKLDSFHDATISAYGATFVLNKGGVSLANCRNTILRGLVLENDPLPFMQGVII